MACDSQLGNKQRRKQGATGIEIPIRRWIVDYKANRREGTDVENFLDRERERDAVQLKSYGAALKDSRQGLYFPLLRGWRQGES